MTVSQLIEDLENQGFCVIRRAFDEDTVRAFRALTMRNRDKMGQTRRVDHSYHLAGFHRFPDFADMNARILENPPINGFLADFFEGDPYCPIGLTDITVNRSQPWHTDLLRGRYARHLDAVDPWQSRRGDCIKALLYLQPGKSLRVVRGSHLSRTPFDDVKLKEIALNGSADQLDIATGDAVMMDIRLLHRGSTDAEMANPALRDDPKILLSTVFGRARSPFARSMQTGNEDRMADWDARHLPA